MLRKIACKHCCSVSELVAVNNNLIQQLYNIELHSLEKNKACKNKEDLVAQYLAAACCISNHRKEAGQDFKNTVLKDLTLLGMHNVLLEISIHSNYEQIVSACSLDTVQFIISTMQHCLPD